MQEGAPSNARKTCYGFLEAASFHTGLSSGDRMKLFTYLCLPTQPGISRFQFSALRVLLRDGKAPEPFQHELFGFLLQQLDQLLVAALVIRKEKDREERERKEKERSKEPSAIRKDKERPKEPSAEDYGLTEALSLIKDVVSYNPEIIRDDQLESLVDLLIILANKTRMENDIDQIAAMFASITQSMPIPDNKLESSVGVLCGISCTRESLASEGIWNIFCNLFILVNQTQTLDILFSILHNAVQDQQSRKLRGAIRIIKHLLEADGANGLPIVPLQPFLEGLQQVSSVKPELRVDSLLTLVSFLWENKSAERLLTADWSALNGIVYEESTDGGKHMGTLAQQYALSACSPLHTFIAHGHLSRPSVHEGMQEQRLQLACLLEARWSTLRSSQREFVLGLLVHVGNYIDNDVMDLAIDHMVTERLFFPSDKDWRLHLDLLLSLCAFDMSKPIKIRCRVLEIARTVIQDARNIPLGAGEPEKLVRHILEFLMDCKEVAITNIVTDFAAEYTLDRDLRTFEEVVRYCLRAVDVERQPSVRSPNTSPVPSNQAAARLVWLFLQSLPRSAAKSKMSFEALISVASNKALPTDARLTVMKLLTRVRCDSEFRLKIVAVPDGLGLAGTLYRTEASSHWRASAYGAPSRASIVTETPGPRIGRTSGVDHRGATRSRSTTRSGGPRDRSTKAIPPLWMYPGSKGLPTDPPPTYNDSVFVRVPGNNEVDEANVARLALGPWLEIILDTLKTGSDWEIYSYVLVHLPSQLNNIALFADCGDSLQALHKIIVVQLRTANLHEPPTNMGVKKGDIAVCLYHSLTALVNYQQHFDREQLDETVRIFLLGISMWDRAAKCCIHALVLCSHEFPANLRRSLFAIITKMSQIITQSHLAIDILEFLAGLVRLPEAYQIAGNDGQDFLRLIFGICINYINHSREQREKDSGDAGVRPSSTPARLSGISNRSAATSDGGQTEDPHRELPEYVFTLAYHVITFWFLAIDLRQRAKHVGWIVKSLITKDESGRECMEEQSQVTIDMIHRTAYNDLGETKANDDFQDANGPIIRATWLYGMSILTLETVQETGLTQITKRQASGTTHAMYQQYTAPLPPHHVPMPNAAGGAAVPSKVFPQHVLLQLGFTIAPEPIPTQPILLPEDDIVKRAISSFDRNDTVDGHKAGVIYIAAGQSSETEILSNTSGTKTYDDFLDGLGTKVRLREAMFNTQGLDRGHDMDGTHTYAWRDRVSEIVFHVTTMMPTNIEEDFQCIGKKRHIGNDYVNIIYNDSGLPFSFDTFSSQFSHVSIVITPEIVKRCQTIRPHESGHVGNPEKADDENIAGDPHTVFFTVQTLCSPSFPLMSPAATPKVVSAKVLPGFVRQLALNASLYSLVWSNRDGGQNVSSWRNRLKEIMKLRQRYANTGRSSNVSYPDMGTPSDRGGAPSYVDGDEWKGRLAMAGLVEQDQFLYSADFTRWN